MQGKQHRYLSIGIIESVGGFTILRIVRRLQI